MGTDWYPNRYWSYVSAFGNTDRDQSNDRQVSSNTARAYAPGWASMALIANCWASELGSAENTGAGNRCSGLAGVQMYACATGRWAGGTAVHSDSRSGDSCIWEHSANVITRE